MLGASGGRVFVYEVEGLRQHEEKNSYSVRKSSNLFVQVPMNRMNDEMRRLTRLGGKIVGIHPLGAAPQAAEGGE
jgi:hypothetical protein